MEQCFAQLKISYAQLQHNPPCTHTWSPQPPRLPVFAGTFEILHGANIVTGNVAAGSERVGFTFFGPACGAASNFADNTAHSNVVGVWLRASKESMSAGCTSLNNITVRTLPGQASVVPNTILARYLTPDLHGT